MLSHMSEAERRAYILADGGRVKADISGRVEIHSDKRKGKTTIRVISDSGIEKEQP